MQYELCQCGYTAQFVNDAVIGTYFKPNYIGSSCPSMRRPGLIVDASDTLWTTTTVGGYYRSCWNGAVMTGWMCVCVIPVIVLHFTNSSGKINL